MFNEENWEFLGDIKGNVTKFIEDFSYESLEKKKQVICEALQELLTNISMGIENIKDENLKQELISKKDYIRDCLIVNKYYDCEKWFVNNQANLNFSRSYKEYHFELLFYFLKTLQVGYYNATLKKSSDVLTLKQMLTYFNECLSKIGISLLFQNEIDKIIFCKEGFSCKALPEETVNINYDETLENDVEIDSLPYMVFYPNILYGCQVGYFSAVVYPGKIRYNQKCYNHLLDQVYFERRRKKEV